METSIKSLIRSSDEILHVLEVYNLPNTLNDGTTSTASSGRGLDIDATLDDPVNKRILAIVTHKDEESDWEEGSVFIFQESANKLGINQVIPIYADFTIDMAQIRRESQDLQPPSPTTSNQHRSGT
ncbi:hypothetical protein D9758_005325 [Tetrapyrgos nigripes]|uniref:Uncharacterized protein n=1 Tax=Tetrapyrgos nigripes TaxID=182062 RepID=A0A8H5LPZ9_9AGAR|nr:hypothetical protein D9758_005325 [Tetrapyrgos nigripes]